jgi:hypothetical protein
VQPDGKILAGGAFSNVGGEPRNRIARLDAASGLADSFNPNANSIVYSIALQADGKILAGGPFTNIGGQPRGSIARLDAASGLADPFDPNANGTVYSIAVQSDGKILAGGFFTTIGGQPRNRVARLSNDTAALSTLAVSSSTVTWTGGGSSPQFSRVVFEQSTDNGATYTFLGNGTLGGPSYTLTGLNLPDSQNILIRARGFYGTGLGNGSESMTESVRNAFIILPTPTAVVSRKIHGEAGTFDLSLPLTGSPGIECRTGAMSGGHTMVFSFANTLASVGGASITSGAGSVSSSAIGSDAHEYVVDLTGVGDAQEITVTLTNVTDSLGNNSASVQGRMALLLGDTNVSGSVNASDISQTKTQSGQAVTVSNFRTDVNANGSINSSDISLVKSRSGTAIP